MDTNGGGRATNIRKGAPLVAFVELDMVLANIACVYAF